MCEILPIFFLTTTSDSTALFCLSDPMRITKKFAGDSSVGKRVFHPACRGAGSASELAKACQELESLARCFLGRMSPSSDGDEAVAADLDGSSAPSRIRRATGKAGFAVGGPSPMSSNSRGSQSPRGGGGGGPARWRSRARTVSASESTSPPPGPACIPSLKTAVGTAVELPSYLQPAGTVSGASWGRAAAVALAMSSAPGGGRPLHAGYDSDGGSPWHERSRKRARPEGDRGASPLAWAWTEAGGGVGKCEDPGAGLLLNFIKGAAHEVRCGSRDYGKLPLSPAVLPPTPAAVSEFLPCGGGAERGARVPSIEERATAVKAILAGAPPPRPALEEENTISSVVG